MSSVGCTVCLLSCLSGAVGFLVLWLDSHFFKTSYSVFVPTNFGFGNYFCFQLFSVQFQSRFSAKIKSGFSDYLFSGVWCIK